jgi:hypothetical protein
MARGLAMLLSALLALMVQALGAVTAGNNVEGSSDLRVYRLPAYHEPNTETSPAPMLDASQPGRHIQIDFPPEAHSGQKRLSYWLTGSEPLRVTIQLGIGPGPGRFPLQVQGAFLLDALQHLVLLADGRPASVLRGTLHEPGDVAEVSITVSALAIADGAHTATLLFWDGEGGEFPGLSFTIFKNSTQFGPRAITLEALLPKRPGEGVTQIRWRGERTIALLGYRPTPLVRPDGHGRLPLEVTLGPGPLAPGVRSTCALISLLDGHQRPLGALGETALMTFAPREEATLSLDLEGLPIARGRHVLLLYLLCGEGQYAEEPPGERAPWKRSPRMVGAVAW